MKLHYIVALLFISIFAQAQIVDIPDANFKTALINQGVDINNDGEIQVTEAEIVNVLDIAFMEINSLEGIQSFTSLNQLDCSDNNLVELDFSQNTNLSILYCDYNDLTDINISKNLNLGFFSCSRNEISSIDISQNLNLINFNISHNNISTIDVSQHQNLSTLRCSFNNLSELDVTQNVGLKDLSCGANNLSSLDVGHNIGLLFLFCGGTLIEELDVSNNSSLYWLQTHFCENLMSLNLRNGGNSGLSLMWAHDTPNLSCILVDNKNFADSQVCGFPTSGWCKDDNSVYSESLAGCSLGIEDYVTTQFTLYPNPTSDVLFVSSERPIKMAKVYSMHGRLLMEFASESVDVSQLEAGAYFVEVLGEGKNVFKKFMKR